VTTQIDAEPLNATIPFTMEERRRFAVYCSERGLKKGAFLRRLTMAVVDGKVDASLLME